MILQKHTNKHAGEQVPTPPRALNQQSCMIGETKDTQTYRKETDVPFRDELTN